MAIYHCAVKIIGRKSGRSSVAAAAYRSGEKLYNEYDGIIHDYTRKGGVVHSEVLLCKNAPREWNNRAALWNAVEKVEKSVRAQLAREYELALPSELDRQEQIELLREYIQKNFVDKGMCADMAIHDKGDGNPHAHVMLTMRPILQDGRWGEKTKKQYFFNPYGEKQYDPVKKLYRSTVVKSTDWDSRDFLREARAAWACAVNERTAPMQVPEIDHRSYKDQCKDQLPTVHLGTTAHRMEQQGIRTELGNINRRIHARNRRVLEIERQLKGLAEERKGLGRIIDIENSEKAQQSPGYAHWAKVYNLHVGADAMNFLNARGIGSYEQLVEVEDAARMNAQNIKKDLSAINEKITSIGSMQRNIIHYMQTKDVYKEYVAGGRKQKFRKAHSTEIEQHEAAKARLHEIEQDLGHKLSMKELKAERAQLSDKREVLKAAYPEARSTSKDLSNARAAVESQLGIKMDIPEQQPKPTAPKKPGDMNLREKLKYYQGEAEKQKMELIQEQQQNKKPGYDRNGPSR